MVFIFERKEDIYLLTLLISVNFLIDYNSCLLLYIVISLILI